MLPIPKMVTRTGPPYVSPEGTQGRGLPGGLRYRSGWAAPAGAPQPVLSDTERDIPSAGTHRVVPGSYGGRMSVAALTVRGGRGRAPVPPHGLVAQPPMEGERTTFTLIVDVGRGAKLASLASYGSSSLCVVGANVDRTHHRDRPRSILTGVTSNGSTSATGSLPS